MDYQTNQNSIQQNSNTYSDKEKVFFERQMVIFTIGREEFGVDISDIREIIHYNNVTKIPGTEEYIEGIIDLRGGIVVIVDLARKIGLVSTPRTTHTRVIVMEVSGSTLGFIVDGCSEVLRLTGENMHAPPQIISSKISGEYVQNVGILGSRIIIIMDLAKVVQDEEIQSLARSSGSTSSVQNGNNAAQSLNTSGKKILLVEDSTLMRSTIKSFMPKSIEVIEAPDGEQGVELFRKNVDNIGLVLLDIKLPGMNGIDVLKELLKIKPEMNIIMETSVYDDTTKDSCMKLGAKDYLKKPINKKQIEDVIAKYLV